MSHRLWVIGWTVLALTACNVHENGRREQTPVRVKTMTVAPQTGSSAMRYVGIVEPVRETPLSMQSAGRVTCVHVKNGDRVQQGQTLIEIDNTQALNTLQGAEAELKHAQDGYDRARQVHDKGVIPDQKMVEIESRLSQAQSLYAGAQQRLEECTLKAPCAGVVDGLDVTIGQTVAPGARVCAVLDVSAFSVRFAVPETEIKGFTGNGEQLTGEMECAAVDRVFPVTVTQKSVTANPVTHTYDVTARVQGGADMLMTGMVAVVKVKQEKTTEDIVIPARCVLLKPEGYTVWLKEQGRAVRRDILVSGYQADGVCVQDGLNAGDTLIIDGYQKLYNDCKVVEDE